jgi:hypothetical protein
LRANGAVLIGAVGRSQIAAESGPFRLEIGAIDGFAKGRPARLCRTRDPGLIKASRVDLPAEAGFPQRVKLAHYMLGKGLAAGGRVDVWVATSFGFPPFASSTQERAQ